MRREAISSDFFRKTVATKHYFAECVQIPQHTNAYRLVNAESDGLPGLIVDQYLDTLVVQFFSSGAERWSRSDRGSSRRDHQRREHF